MGKPAWSHAVRGTEPIAAIDEKLLKYYEASAEPGEIIFDPGCHSLCKEIYFADTKKMSPVGTAGRHLF